MEKFNVYSIEPTVSYSGGALLVAAKTKNDALALVNNDQSIARYFEGFIAIDGTEFPRVNVLENVYAEKEEPCIILSAYYIE